MLDHPTLHRRAAKVLPKAIRTSGVVADDDPRELAKLLFPLRRRSSGAVVFRLAADAAAAMADDPLAFLKDAVRAREGLSRRRAPFAYREWRKARYPAAWTPPWLPHEKQVAGAAAEAYFTAKTDGRALLVVVPVQRVAFYVWQD